VVVCGDGENVLQLPLCLLNIMTSNFNMIYGWGLLNKGVQFFFYIYIHLSVCHYHKTRITILP
jgi:hypothetical protein